MANKDNIVVPFRSQGPISMPEGPKDGGPPEGELSGRVARLEIHMEYVRNDLHDIKGDLKGIAESLRSIPTRADVTSWKIQWVALGFAVMAIVIGGVVGGLAWIAARTVPPPPVPVVIQIPTPPPVASTQLTPAKRGDEGPRP